MSFDTFDIEIKEKGRVVLPVDLRSACGFGVGARLVARVVGPGQVMIESREAVLERIWSGIPEEHTNEVEALAEDRSAEIALLAGRDAACATAGDEAKTLARGEALLSALGLASA
jgi:bifunctional DNA-binding transcriptional regulator/antitoxin component of YhaV-PrlF toxin-antitoxin module